MANTWYTLALHLKGDGGLALRTDDLRLMAVTSGYTPNLDTDQYVSAVGSGNIAGRSATIPSRAYSGRFLTAPTVTIPSPTPGVSILYYLLYKWTGSDASSPLLVKIDQGQNVPTSSLGSDVSVQWGALGVCEL